MPLTSVLTIPLPTGVFAAANACGLMRFSPTFFPGPPGQVHAFAVSALPASTLAPRTELTCSGESKEQASVGGAPYATRALPPARTKRAVVINTSPSFDFIFSASLLYFSQLRSALLVLQFCGEFDLQARLLRSAG